MDTKGYILIRNDHHLAPNRTKKSICGHKYYNINFTRSYWFGTTLFAIREYKKRYKKKFFFASAGLGEGSKDPKIG